MSRRPLIFLRLFTHEASARVPTHSRGLTHLPALSLAQNQGWLSRTQPCSLQAMEAQALVISQRSSSPKSISLEPSSREGAFSTPCGMWKFHRPSQLLLSRGHRPLCMPRLYQASHQPCPCALSLMKLGSEHQILPRRAVSTTDTSQHNWQGGCTEASVQCWGSANVSSECVEALADLD